MFEWYCCMQNILEWARYLHHIYYQNPLIRNFLSISYLVIYKQVSGLIFLPFSVRYPFSSVPICNWELTVEMKKGATETLKFGDLGVCDLLFLETFCRTLPFVPTAVGCGRRDFTGPGAIHWTKNPVDPQSVKLSQEG